MTLKSIFVTVILVITATISSQTAVASNPLRIYDDGKHMVVIHLFSLKVSGNRVSFFRTDSFKEPCYLDDLPQKFQEEYQVTDDKHPGKSVANVPPPGEFRCMYSHHVVNVVDKTVLMDYVSFFREDVPRQLIWAGYMDDHAALSLDDPIESAIYNFCKELVKEYRIRGITPGPIWID